MLSDSGSYLNIFWQLVNLLDSKCSVYIIVQKSAYKASAVQFFSIPLVCCLDDRSQPYSILSGGRHGREWIKGEDMPHYCRVRTEDRVLCAYTPRGVTLVPG